VISSRAANIFYFPPSEWGLTLIRQQLAAGALETFHAALILPLVFLTLLALILKLRLWLMFDTLFLYLPAGHAIGRIGCLLVGCCWGHPMTLSIFGSTYTFDNPVPLYEIGLNLLLFIFLRLHYHRIYGSGRHSSKGRGRIAAFYLIGYGIIRMGLELLRKEKAVGWGLTLAQWGMMGFIFAGLTGLIVIYLRDRSPKPSNFETQTP